MKCSVCVYVCVKVCVNGCVGLCVGVCMCVCLCICIGVCALVYVLVCVCVRMHRCGACVPATTTIPELFPLFYHPKFNRRLDSQGAG